MKILKRLLKVISFALYFPILTAAFLLVPITTVLGGLWWVITGDDAEDISLAPIEGAFWLMENLGISREI